MIDAKELRIGNKIRYTGHATTVNEIIAQRNYVGTEELINGDLEHYDGIPLTEELLKKCGFVKDESLMNDVNLWPDYELDNVRIALPYFDFVADDISKEIKYLHGLQNLYFALTGKELTTTF